MDFPICETGSALNKISDEPISYSGSSQSKKLLEFLLDVNISSKGFVQSSSPRTNRRRLNSLGRFAGYEVSANPVMYEYSALMK